MRWLAAALLLLAAPALAQTAIRPDQITGTGDITWGLVGSGYQIGSTIPWRTDSTTTPVFIAGDATKTVELTNSGAITSTLPDTTGANLGDGFGFTIQVGPGKLTLTATGAQTINGVASIIVGPYQIVGLSSKGTNWYAAQGIPQSWASVTGLTWGPGQNLSTATLPIMNVRAAITILAIRCTPGALAGAAATFKIWKAASGTALGSGTDLATGSSCNANTGANADQNFTLTTTTAAAGERIGLVSSTWPTGTTSVGSGVVTIWYKW